MKKQNRRTRQAPLSLDWRLLYQLAGWGPLTCADLAGRLPDLAPGIVAAWLELLVSDGRAVQLDDGRFSLSPEYVAAFERALAAWWQAYTAQQEVGS